MLDTGVSRGTIAQTMLNSAERFGNVVDQMYDTYLHRKADAAGRAYWVGVLLGGGNEDAVATSFMLSSEYAAMHAGNQEFVKALYRDVLGRAPTRPARPSIWRRWRAAKRAPSWSPHSWAPTSVIIASSTSSTCSFISGTPT